MDEINFGEKSVITLADRNASVDATTGGTDFQHVNADVSSVIISDALTIGYEDVQITEDLVVGGDYYRLACKRCLCKRRSRNYEQDADK